MAATMFQCNENGYTVQHLLFKTNKQKKRQVVLWFDQLPEQINFK